MMKDRLKLELSETESLIESWCSLSEDDKMKKMEKIIRIVSIRIKDLRLLFVKQTLALKKFEKEAGSDWRNSKYVYAISSVHSIIFQLRALIGGLLDANNSLLEVGASINKTVQSFCVSGNVDAFSHEKWVSLKEPSDLPEHLQTESQFIKQRSKQWFDLRSKFPITGSKIFEGIGLDTLKNLQKHVQNVLSAENNAETISEEVQKRMDHGTKSEINAVATLVGKILPFFFPSLQYIEEGSHIIRSGENPFMLISPDGSLGKAELSYSEIPERYLGCEFKCPVPVDFRPTVHYQIPIR